MFRSIVASAAVVALAASASAQTPQQIAGNLEKVTNSTTIQYTMGEGYQVVNTAQRSGPETIFNNRDGSIYYYTTRANTDEFVDEGSFRLAGVNGTEQVNGMVFDYCSTVPDSVGDAIDIEIRMYDEVVGFTGITGWVDANNRNEKCGYLLAGMPGDTNLAGLSCWIVTLNLNAGFECTLPQEQTVGGMDNFGHSTVFMDAQNSMGTGPLLDSLFGTQLGNDYGVQDYFEYYDMSQALGAEYLGTYWYGGGAKAQANFLTSLDGNPTDTEAYYSANMGSADTVDLQADVEVRAGQAAGWTITNVNAGSNYALIASTGTADIPALVGGNAHLLVNWMGAPLLPAPFVMAGGTYAQNLPPALPPSIHVQAAEYQGALSVGNIVGMSNGLTHSN
ncbi:MAG: hypothetical protein QF489_00080 [Planctomycetota bacterium]|jgi:hypothetical protein|nr:hypothetical protein [Planctomycetota bacterium]